MWLPECYSSSLPISVLTQDWQEIVALYEKDNIYLGKVAQPGRLESRGSPLPEFWDTRLPGGTVRVGDEAGV